MQCSFSLTQIGEFAFILATLGTSLGVTSDFLYPIVVAVSVFTTFTTPYMIRLAEPAYMMVARTLPAKWMARLERNKDESDEKAPDELQQMYDKCFKHFVFTMLINSVLCIAIMSIMYYYGQSLIASLVPRAVESPHHSSRRPHPMRSLPVDVATSRCQQPRNQQTMGEWIALAC